MRVLLGWLAPVLVSWHSPCVKINALPGLAVRSIFQASLLTWIHLTKMPSRLAPLASCFGHRSYSVGHAAELHRLPDSPVAWWRRAPADCRYQGSAPERYQLALCFGLTEKILS